VIVLQLVGVLLLVNAGLAAWMWRHRERQIAAAWHHLKRPLDLATSIPRIDRCIERLVAEYGVDSFAGEQRQELPKPTPWPSMLEELAQLAAQHWQVTLPPLDLRLCSGPVDGEFSGTFSENGQRWTASLRHDTPRGAPGLEGTNLYQIQIARAVFADPEALPVVMAHEISHLVLARDGVVVEGAGETEVLTDVATALVGFGRLMLRLRSREQRFFGPGINLSWRISGPGYLLPEELAYVLQRHEALRQEWNHRQAIAGRSPGELAT